MELVGFGLVLFIVGVAVAAKLMSERIKLEEDSIAEHSATVDGVPMTIEMGAVVGLDSGTVIRTTAVPGPVFTLLLAPHPNTLFAKIDPPDRITLDDAGFEATLHVWSNEIGMARWWMSSLSLRERLSAAEGRWGYRINAGTL